MPESSSQRFAPVFIVGAPRSGTTMLAVLFDRHSRLAIPPETQFFIDFPYEDPAAGQESTDRAHKVGAALDSPRIKDLQLSPEAVLAKFARYENSYHTLFQAILETYAEKKNTHRVGEKSPKHIEHVPQLLRLYPEAKIICIIRDGRDVVRSLLKTPWAEPGNSRRFGLFCLEWSKYTRLLHHYTATLPAERFTYVSYESLVQQPENQLRTLCEFIGEEFEPQMLQSEEASEVVPQWEAEWKNKAGSLLDPGRAAAWKRQADQKQVWRMNMMMGPELQLFGYQAATLKNCPYPHRALYFMQKIPYMPSMHKISLVGLKLARRVRSIFSI